MNATRYSDHLLILANAKLLEKLNYWDYGLTRVIRIIRNFGAISIIRISKVSKVSKVG